jgi:hypothetical protein
VLPLFMEVSIALLVILIKAAVSTCKTVWARLRYARPTQRQQTSFGQPEERAIINQLIPLAGSQVSEASLYSPGHRFLITKNRFA